MNSFYKDLTHPKIVGQTLVDINVMAPLKMRPAEILSVPVPGGLYGKEDVLSC